MAVLIKLIVIMNFKALKISQFRPQKQAFDWIEEEHEVCNETFKADILKHDASIINNAN